MATETTKHTPGPWGCDEVRTSCGRAFRIGAGEMLKAGNGCCIIYDDYPGNPDNERKANARLIAAAPETAAERDRLKEINSDLLAALERIEQQLDYGQTEAAHKTALSALAKARGEG